MVAGRTPDQRPPRLPPAWLVPPVLRLRDLVARVHRGLAPPALRVIESTGGLIEAKALYAAAELRVAEALGGGPLTTADLAVAVDADADPLGRLLRLLATRGYFRRDRRGRWHNTPTSDVLRADHPDTLRSWVLFAGSPWHGEIWNSSLHSFRTGESASRAALGTGFFDWLVAHPDEQVVFDAAMAETARLVGPALAARHDFEGVQRVCDVGGGNGALLAHLLVANPHLRGVVLDLPSVVEGAGRLLVASGVESRCDTVGGDFFAEVPGGCDRYVLKSVLHDWDDDSCSRILAAVRSAMPPGARVLVLDAIVPDNAVSHPAHAFDLLMLVLTGAGRERTAGEWAALFDRAGFRVERRVDLAVVVLQELVPKA